MGRDPVPAPDMIGGNPLLIMTSGGNTQLVGTLYHLLTELLASVICHPSHAMTIRNDFGYY